MMDEIQNDAYLYSVGLIALYKAAGKDEGCAAYNKEMKIAGAVSLKLAESSDVKENSDFAGRIREAHQSLHTSMEALKELNYSGKHSEKKEEILVLGKALDQKMEKLSRKLIF